MGRGAPRYPALERERDAAEARRELLAAVGHAERACSLLKPHIDDDVVRQAWALAGPMSQRMALSWLKSADGRGLDENG